MTVTSPSVSAAALFQLDEGGRLRLRRMKRVAGGFLAATAAVFVATFAMGDSSAVGYLRAAAEAGMVGGLADWFAVTALFRRPLGLPIPHTAIIPSKKDELAAQLGTFVTRHFLTRDAILERLRSANPTVKAAQSLLEPGRAGAIARRASEAFVALVSRVPPHDVAVTVLDFARHDLASRSYARLSGTWLVDVTDGGLHTPMLDVALPYIRTLITDNRRVLHRHITALAEDNGFLGWLWSSDKRVSRAIDGLVGLIEAMEKDRKHDLRQALDDLLGRLGQDLQHKPELTARVDAVLLDLLADPKTQVWLEDALSGLLESVGRSLADASVPVPSRIAQAITDVCHRALTDQDFQARLQAWIEDAVMYAVDHGAADEFMRLIERTVSGWSGKDMASNVEQMAGSDLQFVRINGTVVGALAGLIIFSIAQLLF